MEITCKPCDKLTQELRIRGFIANVCPDCQLEIGVRGFPLDSKYTVDHALNRRLVSEYDTNEFIKMIEENNSL